MCPDVDMVAVARFSLLVAEDEFGSEPLNASSHWATVILLWLRKAPPHNGFSPQRSAALMIPNLAPVLVVD